MKKIIFSYGGSGAGKSTALVWLVENAIMQGIDFGIVEADSLIPDVGYRYKKKHDVILAPLERVDEKDIMEGIGRMYEGFEALNQDVVFVNLPPNASMRLDLVAGIIDDALRSDNISLRVMLVADNRAHSRALVKKSLKDGIMSYADKNLVVQNLCFGGSTDENWRFCFENRHGHKPYVESMPEVQPRVWRVVSQYAAPLTTMMPDLISLDSSLLKKWIRSADNAIALLLDK